MNLARSPFYQNTSDIFLFILSFPSTLFPRHTTNLNTQVIGPSDSVCGLGANYAPPPPIISTAVDHRELKFRTKVQTISTCKMWFFNFPIGQCYCLKTAWIKIIQFLHNCDLKNTYFFFKLFGFASLRTKYRWTFGFQTFSQ